MIRTDKRLITKTFMDFIQSELSKVYGKGSGVKVDVETIEYKHINDIDYPTVWECMEFVMSDGKKYEAFMEHKGRAYLKNLY